MNIDSITRLIEASDVADFRTLSAQFLPMIGLEKADFCDGSYDGGKDFTIIETVKGIKIGIQLSVEKNWRKKIKSDAIKTKKTSIQIYYILSLVGESQRIHLQILKMKFYKKLVLQLQSTIIRLLLQIT
jgi:hypothetical protein